MRLNWSFLSPQVDLQARARQENLSQRSGTEVGRTFTISERASSILQYTTVCHSILQYSILQYITVYCNTQLVRELPVYYSILQYTTVCHSILLYTTVYFTVYCSTTVPWVMLFLCSWNLSMYQMRQKRSCQLPWRKLWRHSREQSTARNSGIRSRLWHSKDLTFFNSLS